jgi:hypothetical protein
MKTELYITKILSLRVRRYADTRDCIPFFSDELDAVDDGLRGCFLTSGNFVFEVMLN